MASYDYDESGNMALYFIVTILFMVLVPVTLSSLFSSNPKDTIKSGCECGPCVEQRKKIQKREKRSLLHPHFTRKGVFMIVGWLALALLSYKLSGAATDTKIYDPFEILGLKTGVTEKEIKSHFKKLSKQFHPDKVKLSGNDTIESAASKFVEITKAYKSLTDETIRKNFEDYGHPDGRQTVTMGIALPRWIVEAQNNIWVLGVYGLLFGLSLPALVGRWWFGSRQKTKDGINAQTASAFFKSLNENSGVQDIIDTLSKAVEWQHVERKGADKELKELDEAIGAEIDGRWKELKSLTRDRGDASNGRWRALVLLYAHLLRIPIRDSSLRKAQADVLLRTPSLLNALMNISLSRNWFFPTVGVMHLQAYLAQALSPDNENATYAQLPGISKNDVKLLPTGVDGIDDFVHKLEGENDDRLPDVKKAVERWGRLEIVDKSFNVIGERIVTPSALVFLVLKLRLTPPTSTSQSDGVTHVESVDSARANAKKDDEFLNSPMDAEDIPNAADSSGWAHAPYWPARRRPGWWIVLADAKSNRLVVPPMKITDIPFSNPARERNYRSYKLRFQAPPAVGLFTWRIHLVSDTFLGEDVVEDITLKTEDISTLNVDEQGAEDEISDPEEDTLAGQMAAMRGGSVKKHVEESEDESSTDEEDEGEETDSSSDSD
ncbi:DnaJ-domain-containing protein [Dentipellis sp. KUC8613]|nr:DnaJ-domain-containing protein [Dentipellis sp. KUC8613]